MSKDKPRDGDNIPLEEMMRRLKEGDEKDNRPELVTREDGTQAIRKRKKKRRSSQPHKEEKKKRQKALFIQLGVVALIIFTFCASIVFFLIKYNRTNYADGIAKKVSEVTGTDVEFGRFSASPLEIKISDVKLAGGKSDYLDEVTFSKVTVDRSIPSFFIGNMEGESVSAEVGDAILKLPESHQLANLRTLQEEFIFTHYDCSDFSVSFGDPITALVKILNTRLLMYEKTNSTELRLNKGSIKIKGFGDYLIKNGTLEILKDSFDIAGITLGNQSGKGEIEISESISLKPTEKSTLRAHLREVDTLSILSNNLGSILIGHLSSEGGTIAVDFESDQFFEVIIPFNKGSLELDRLPFINVLKETLQIHKVRPSFDTVRGVINRVGQKTVIDDLYLEDVESMIVSGKIIVSVNGVLSGQLSVGVAKSLIISADGSLRAYGFSEPRDGMCWVNVKLGGSTSSPQDNLRQILESAAKQGGVKATGSFEGVFEQLTE